MLQQSPTRTQGTSQGKARLFFALTPDPQTRDTLYRCTRSAVDSCGGRPTRPENLHITLAFLGQIEPDAARQAVAAAQEVTVEPFSIVLEEIGYWPKAEVIWLGCAAVSADARNLALELKQRLRARGLRLEDQDFTLHMTLARWVHKASAVKSITPIRWTVRDFALVRSVTRRGGVEYTALERWPLGRQGTLI